MSTEMTLHSYRRCPFAMRVRLTLHEKQVAFIVKEEDLKNKSEELKRLHPEARVPLLVHEGHAFYESAIINEYLDEAFAELPLMPKKALERAQVRLWTYWCNHEFKWEVDRFKYGTHRFPEAECIGAKDRLIQHLEKIENALKKEGWLVGGMYSLADINVFPFFRQLHKIHPIPDFLSHFKESSAWLKKIEARPAFLKAMEKKP
jgi:glutathione S-transferase